MSRGPASDAEAFEWARLERPSFATQVRHWGQSGLDRLVLLQFVVPGATEARAVASAIGCTLAPIEQRRANPFRLVDASHPVWWVHEAPPGALACRHAPSGRTGLARSVRADPAGDRFRVQVSATTQ